MREFRTVLEQKIRERRQTFEEFVEAAEVFAGEHGEPGTLSVRHLQRLAAGRGPGGQPLGPVRPATARLLERMFGLPVDELLVAPDTNPVVELDEIVGGDVADWVPWSMRRDVVARLQTLDLGRVRERDARLRDVGRSQVARALIEYYGSGGVYRPMADGRPVLTSVYCPPAWSELAVPLTLETDRIVLGDVGLDAIGRLEDVGGQDAAERLAEAAALGVRMTNKPLYRLLDIDVRADALVGRVGLVPFGVYALSMDLLERELVGAVAEGQHHLLPLRDRYLPDLAAVLDLRGRVCAGGVLGLCAIARPADPYRGPADYALLVQERSGQVLNAARRLAVIPKGFHEPLKDVRADTRIGATLLREMEEELFGREEVDSTAGDSRSAAPMHPGRLSAPMRWLAADAERTRLECTGFGLNLVSGNYEFACLVVIDDEEFWSRFGGDIEANWESSGLRVYSSLDGPLVSELITDENWSNEGLFAFLQGIRRLAEIGGQRVSLPAVRS